MIELSRRDARRLAVQAQLLAAPQPRDLLEVFAHLDGVQADMTAYVAPNVDLLCHSRIAGYRPSDLDALADSGALVELRGMLRPVDDIALYLDEMAHWPGVDPHRDWQLENQLWIEANDAARREVLAALRSDGPLTTSELPNVCDVPWKSSGWTDEKTLQALLNMMVQRGEVAVAGRQGQTPLWDLASRVYADVRPVPVQEAFAERARRQLRSLGIMRPAFHSMLGLRTEVEPPGPLATVEGLRGRWWIDERLLDDPFRGRTVLLSPLDRLVFDRKRMAELFDFDYQLEMYKPRAKRRFGYFALPVLHGDRLVGKVDAEAKPATGVLEVHTIHRDLEFSDSLEMSLAREIRSLATMLDLEVRLPD